MLPRWLSSHAMRSSLYKLQWIISPQGLLLCTNKNLHGAMQCLPRAYKSGLIAQGQFQRTVWSTTWDSRERALLFNKEQFPNSARIVQCFPIGLPAAGRSYCFTALEHVSGFYTVSCIILPSSTAVSRCYSVIKIIVLKFLVSAGTVPIKMSKYLSAWFNKQVDKDVTCF